MTVATLEGAKIIILLGDGRMALRVIRCFGSLQTKFTLLSKDRDNVARASKYCVSFVYSDPQSDSELLHQLESLPRSDIKEIILPITTEGFQFVSRNSTKLAERFRIPPISSVQSLVIASDKWKLYDFARKHDLPVLRSIPLSSLTDRDMKNGNLDMDFPLLLKTRGKEGGDGFRKASSPEELIELQKEINLDDASRYIVQRFITGRDVSLSVYCEKGTVKCYTLWSAIAYGKAKYKIPTCIEFVENEQALEIGKRLMKLLEWEGICDIDFFLDEQSGEIWLLEINARFWGNLVACASYGVDFLALMCQKAVGESPNRYPKQSQGVYCYPKGLAIALRNSRVRRSIIKSPLRSTGSDAVLNDIAPEFYKLYLKIKRILKRCIRAKNQA